MDGEAPTGQEAALLLAELRKLTSKVENLERESREKDRKLDQVVESVKKKDEQIKKLIKQIGERDAVIQQMDEFARQINNLGKRREKGKNIFQSMMAYIKEHPYLVATAVTAGIIGGFLVYWGVPIVWGAVITWKSVVAGGCVAGGTTLLVSDVVVTEMDNKKLQ